MKADKSPWMASVSANQFCIVSQLASSNIDPQNVNINLSINNKVIIEQMSKNMHWDIPELVDYITRYMTISKGDMLLTGNLTPMDDKPIMLDLGDKIYGSLVFGGIEVAHVETEVIKRE